MHRNTAQALCLALLIFVPVLLAGEFWSKKDAQQWSADDINRLLTDSPWAQQTNAQFAKDLQDDATAPVPVPTPAQTGMPGPNGASDGRWDGGVGRNNRGGVPSLPVLVRWDSALPVREALERNQSMENSPDAHTTTFTADQAAKDYIITVVGLIPAKRRSAPTPEMLHGMLRMSRLIPRDHAAIVPEDAKLDAETGALHLFFPRTEPITAGEKEVTFVTRFGSLTVQKRFRLKDMTYRGKLDL